jgi:serine protease
VDWCSLQKARIINLSLGSKTLTPAAERLYIRLQQEGILVISSSGNGYNDDYNYPASFDAVVSVGATDSSGRRASFSNYNDQVNIVAPGVAIRSTSPLSAISDGTNVYEMRSMEYSTMVNEPLSGKLHDAGSGISDLEYANARGKICIAPRGITSFLDKALLCEKYGGIALVVYNNATGLFTGTLVGEGLVSVPVVGVSQIDGALLKRQGSEAEIVISPLMAGYSTKSGTSMATAFGEL